MKTLKMPSFWYASHFEVKSKTVSLALWPLSYAYRFACLLDRAATIQYKSRLPVICIGNVTMGGGGKTPTARAVFNFVKEHGRFKNPCFLMRGYRGNASGPLEVDPKVHTVWDVGDEALMQVRYGPVIVSRNRRQGAKLAEQRGYDLIIMDDGFQNYSLYKTLSILVVDGSFGFGNGLCFPAGPLREPVPQAVSRAQMAIVINPDKHFDSRQLRSIGKFDAELELLHKKDQAEEDTDKKSVIAFAGIARPEKFFTALEHSGYSVHARFAFGDHHTYTHDQLKRITQRAEKDNLQVITTEKDWIKLAESWKRKIGYIKIAVKLDEQGQDALRKALDRFK